MQIRELMRELGQRRVFRAAVIYAALVWVALQVADVFAGEGIIPEAWVRYLILAAAVGLPLVLIGSWFLESPWKRRGRIALVGDLFVLFAIAIGAGLFAWQQWFRSAGFTLVEVGEIQATDMQPGTRDLAEHLEGRLASFSSAGELSPLRFEGTLSRRDDFLRLTLSLVDSSGRISWSESFEKALVDQASLQQDVVNAVASNIASLTPWRDYALTIIEACPYPGSTESVLALAGDLEPEQLAEYIELEQDNGLLYLRQAIGWFVGLPTSPAHQRPVLFALAKESLDRAESVCPDFYEIEVMRAALRDFARAP